MAKYRHCCPACNEEMLCGCKSCAKQNEGKVTEKIDGDLMSCGHCGHTMHVDQWLDYEMALFRVISKYRNIGKAKKNG